MCGHWHWQLTVKYIIMYKSVAIVRLSTLLPLLYFSLKRLEAIGSVATQLKIDLLAIRSPNLT